MMMHAANITGSTSMHPNVDFNLLPGEAKEDFKVAMRLMASTVTIITTQADDGRYGLTATAVCSLAMDPPMILICVDRSSKSHPAIFNSRRFCVNLLAEHQSGVAGAFANGKLSSEEKFHAAGEWRVGEAGLPVLGDAVANIECDAVETIEAASHTIFLGSVRNVTTSEARGPLLYANRRFGSIVPDC